MTGSIRKPPDETDFNRFFILLVENKSVCSTTKTAVAYLPIFLCSLKAGRKGFTVPGCSQMIVQGAEQLEQLEQAEDVVGNISQDHHSPWLADWC